MKNISLDPQFIVTPPQAGSRLKELRETTSVSALAELRHALGDTSFNTAYDLLRLMAIDYVNQGTIDHAISLIRDADTLLMRAGEQEGKTLDLHAAMMQILTALLIEQGDMDEAKKTAAATMTLLAQEPKRKDEPFLAVLGSLLFDIAYLHSQTNEFKQAERELEKSLKVFERLARINAERYGSAHILAQNAVTQVYRSRVKQANLLAHYQVATSTYLDMVNRGIEDSIMRLVESLHTEGRTLVSMGRHREAVQYFTRALKYLTKANPVFDRQQLAMSVDLGEALLHLPASRDKGIHLLNTMLHKATKINADDEHRRIVDILVNAKTRHLDILGFWHKVFPR